MDNIESEFSKLLEFCHEELLAGRSVSITMENLMSGLAIFRTDAKTQWKYLVERIADQHPLRKILHQDPFTRHAYTQPKGYPGDASLLDFIYDGNNTKFPFNVSNLGLKIFHSNIQEPSCRAIRSRMRHISRKIDDICNSPSKQILSVACGHIREAHLSTALKAGSIGRYVALDQDPSALNTVESELGKYGIETIQAKIMDICKGNLYLGEFDFVYVSGLYDYLDDHIAGQLTGNLFTLLKPGGVLLIANFLPDILGAAYMEAFMRWNLIYRDENTIRWMVETNCFGRYAIETYREVHGNIVFAEVQRFE